MFGVRAKEMIGKRFAELRPDDDFETVHRHDREALEGKVTQQEYYDMRAERPRTIHVVRIPIRDTDGDIVGLCGIGRDITDIKRAQQEIARADKLESVGVLAAGIAHDFNNLLAAILGNVSLAIDMAGSGDATTEILKDVEAAAVRARGLTDQLLTFSKGGAPITDPTSLEDIIMESAEFAVRGSNVKCEYAIDDNLWAINADRGQISQVINNMVINAQQAMLTGGKILIKARNRVIGKDEHRTLPSGSYSEVSIQDQGKGMSAVTVRKAFDPFFTTKDKGSGLGLAICHSIIQKHNGHIEVESIESQGSTFTVLLPATESVAESPAISYDAVTGRTGRILVMDDDRYVLRTAQEILKRAGHTVETAEDGADMLKKYERAIESGTPFDVVILDLTVPGGMGGIESVGRLKQLNPDATAIVSSGYSNDPVMAEYREYGFEARLTKPYGSFELRQVVGCLLPAKIAASETTT